MPLGMNKSSRDLTAVWSEVQALLAAVKCQPLKHWARVIKALCQQVGAVIDMSDSV